MKLGLSLAGGGTKGFAHIGALKAFEEAHIQFDFISGTSSGSIVATLYAIGYRSDEIYEIFKKHVKKIRYVDLRNILRIGKHFLKTGKLRIQGLNSGETIFQLVNQFCKEKKIEDISQIQMPLLIPAVNICDEQLYVFYSKSIENLVIPKHIKYINHIKVATAVQASCSYPGIFCPCDKLAGTLLIDGGIEENIPWREVKRVGADKVISIVFSDDTPKKCCNSIIEILNKSFAILCHELARYEWNGSDYLLKIKTNQVGLLNKNHYQELYQEGYEQTKQFIKQTLDIL